jgi:hypothetical protein
MPFHSVIPTPLCEEASKIFMRDDILNDQKMKEILSLVKGCIPALYQA